MCDWMDPRKVDRNLLFVQLNNQYSVEKIKKDGERTDVADGGKGRVRGGGGRVRASRVPVGVEYVSVVVGVKVGVGVGIAWHVSYSAAT
jgi:hypothetical protein